jgi:hypothetical protein
MSNLMFLLILCGGIWLAIAISKPANKRHKAQRRLVLPRWHHAVQTCATFDQFRLAQVIYITQRSRHGTKAWLRWYRSNEQQDAWFDGEFPPCGAWVVVSGLDGYGPHTNNPRIFYVHELHDVIVF